MNWIEAVYRQEYRGLFLLALSITASHQQAEDAVHEAISRACRQRRPPAGDHAAYVYRAVRNAAIETLPEDPREVVVLRVANGLSFRLDRSLANHLPQRYAFSS